MEDTKTIAPDPVEELRLANIKANAKVKELCERFNVKTIHALVFRVSKDEPICIGYMRDPHRAVKLRILDSSLQSAYTTCGNCLETYLIVEESDPRILEDDAFYLGAAKCLLDTVETAGNMFKKN